MKEKRDKDNFWQRLKSFDYRWISISLVALLLWILCNQRGYCQSLSTSNPGEYTVLATGNLLTKIKQWEQKYNSYLKTAEGYASALKAATSIYDDGMRILLNLDKIRQACSNNPQGIAATISMNNLYAETVTEFVSVFSLLKQAVAKGGKENMLTGAERSKTLWELEDRLKSLSDKLKLLHYSIRHYRMADVWYQATAGMIERDKREVALQSLSHWKRYAKEVSEYR